MKLFLWIWCCVVMAIIWMGVLGLVMVRWQDGYGLINLVLGLIWLSLGASIYAFWAWKKE